MAQTLYWMHVRRSDGEVNHNYVDNHHGLGQGCLGTDRLISESSGGLDTRGTWYALGNSPKGHGNTMPLSGTA